MEIKTTWIDAWISWDRNSKEIVDDEQQETEDCEEEEQVPPSIEFSFDYKLRAREADTTDSTRISTSKQPSLDDTTLTLTLKGFPSESGQIWNSTGLTLWSSSHYLCEYLLDHYRELLLFDPASSSSTTSSSTTTSALNNHPRNNKLEDKGTKTKTSTPPERIPEILPRKLRAVELGSGLGRCGLLLYHIMKTHQHQHTNMRSHVYLTDGDTDTLAQLRDNVIDNTTTNRNNDGTPESIPMASITDKDQKHEQQRNSINPNRNISCHQLLWGRDST
jgi:hypothetical protein